MRIESSCIKTRKSNNAPLGAIAMRCGAPVYYAFPSAAISRKTISAIRFAECAPIRADLLPPLNELTVTMPYEAL
jgi:hypothetical protein